MLTCNCLLCQASVRELYNMVCMLLELEKEKVCPLTLESQNFFINNIYLLISQVSFFSLSSFKVSIWDYYNKTKHQFLNNFDQTLEEAQLLMDQEVRMLCLLLSRSWLANGFGPYMDEYRYHFLYALCRI